ncbi:MAG TPA: hypothetical protein DCZ61_01080 [Lachnospiraceae bacterium]|nr:hypothetical protein [Lachnospiraceae bacterium]HBB60370.1 hypothetical protein [Lachnospiraceae bacterium]
MANETGNSAVLKYAIKILYILDVMLISYDRIRQNQGFPQGVTEEQFDKLGDFYIKKALEIDKENNLLSHRKR